MSSAATCKARQYSDQMLCDYCGLAWDTNDPDPPECRTVEWFYKQKARQEIAKMKRVFL